MPYTVQKIEETRFDHESREPRICDFWDQNKVYEFQSQSNRPIFSIDTPPPYVSAAHLHVGHAMSYSQAEFIVRYKRMKGFNVFYPMGFDDNGLPTERFVENTYKINKKQTTRSAFRSLCIEETTRGAKAYEKMWRALGLSVDWRLRYSSIDEHSRRTAQKSFIDLYRIGRVYRSQQPVLWDTVFETALAQADLETVTRKGKLYDVKFKGPHGSDLVITTSRPEMLPACVSLFCNPNDARYQHLKNTKAIVPLFGHEVPVNFSEEVDPQFGTGLMMVCTFGDGEDVKKWQEFHLGTRECIKKDGRLNDLAGRFAGMGLAQARVEIVKDLMASGHILHEENTDQNVIVGERSGEPVEFQMTPQWFVKILDLKEKMLARSNELQWHPQHMKVRLDQWIAGLKYDWNISRQRFYGVPFPVWYVKETGEVILADEESLPVDPLEDLPPKWAREKYKGMTIVGEPDVMDTWMTSSLSPLINSNWAASNSKIGTQDVFPMSLRVQAFEIIRTWLFYTLVKSELHCGSLPWEGAMISGWGLNEQGKKISKRDLEQYTDDRGFNRYDPYSIIQRYGADALRYWAAGSGLGNDLRFHEKDVKAGSKLVTKLWNVARMCVQYLEGYDPKKDVVELQCRPLEDRWLISSLNKVVDDVTNGFESCNYSVGRVALEKFFWSVYCDNYLEIVKDRFWNVGQYSVKEKNAAQATLYESMRTLLGLYAPYMPFVTEELYQRIYSQAEGVPSIHLTAFPLSDPLKFDACADKEMKTVLGVSDAVRAIRAQEKNAKVMRELVIETDIEDILDQFKRNEHSILSATRCTRIAKGKASHQTNISGLTVDLT